MIRPFDYNSWPATNEYKLVTSEHDESSKPHSFSKLKWMALSPLATKYVRKRIHTAFRSTASSISLRSFKIIQKEINKQR